MTSMTSQCVPGCHRRWKRVYGKRKVKAPETLKRNEQFPEETLACGPFALMEWARKRPKASESSPTDDFQGMDPKNVVDESPSRFVMIPDDKAMRQTRLLSKSSVLDQAPFEIRVILQRSKPKGVSLELRQLFVFEGC